MLALQMHGKPQMPIVKKKHFEYGNSD